MRFGAFEVMAGGLGSALFGAIMMALGHQAATGLVTLGLGACFLSALAFMRGQLPT